MINFYVAVVLTLITVSNHPVQFDQPRSNSTTSNQAQPYACGPAALAVVLTLLNKQIPSGQLELLPDSDGSTTLLALQNAAERLGLFAVGVKLTPKKLLQLRCPAILHMQVTTRDRWTSIEHYVTFAGVDRHGRPVLIDTLPASAWHGPVEPGVAFEYWTGQAVLLSDQPFPFSITPHWWVKSWAELGFWWIVLPSAVMMLPVQLSGSILKTRSR